MGIATASAESVIVSASLSQIGWLEVPPGGQTTLRAPIAGFVVASQNQALPALGQEVIADSELAQINVFLTPQEVSQLVTAKEDNDVQIDQAVTTMQLSQEQLDNVKQAGEAVTGVRLNELKQSLAHAKSAFNEAKDKLPFLIREPYENGLLVSPVKIVVPRAGRILQIHALSGQFVQVGEPMWSVADWTRMWLRVPLPASRLGKIKLGQPITYYDGSTIRMLEPVDFPIEIKPQTRTIDVIYEVDNSNWKLRAGESLTVNLPFAEADDLRESSLQIPISAILYNEFGQASCYVAVEEPEGFKRVAIELGPNVDGRVVVTRGLNENERIVIVGAELLAAEASKGDLVVDDD